MVNFRDPFYASIAPQFFAIAAATVVAYLLVIIILITPGTFFVGGPGGGRAFLGRGGSSSVVGVGRRPWLQKIAALSVAVSLTMASADTFKFCERQYNAGYSDAGALVDRVNAGMEIRVVRVISDTFLWLAQVQTLIRLFPRHKEKVTIKWLGFALILFDTVFSILNNFIFQSAKSRPRSFGDAIPALSYLFELAIGLIYASCVVYYSLSKRRFAFWHAKMRNICLVAACSLIAVLIPVVFFVLDVSNSDVATWGGYIRWVGAAAASVVVWEWVERIEALERDERKDGILGREIFDGDDMLDMTPSEEVGWPGRSPTRRNDDGNAGNASGRANGNSRAHRPLRSRAPFQSRQSQLATAAERSTGAVAHDGLPGDLGRRPPTLPPQAITPISRADTSSASTIYAVRRLPLSTPSPQIPEDAASAAPVVPKDASSLPSDDTMVDVIHPRPAGLENGTNQESAAALQPKKNTTALWRVVPNPFKRRRASPPAEVAGAQLTTETPQNVPVSVINRRHNTRWRVNAIAGSRKRTYRGHGRGQNLDTPLEVTVIPAQRRGQRTWSPDDLVDPEVEEDEDEMEIGHHDPYTNIRDDRLSPTQSGDSADIPVTIIPAPGRNQRRTWSPQELERPWIQAISGSSQAPFLGDELHPSPLSNGQPRSEARGKEPVDNTSDPVVEAPSNCQLPAGAVLSRRGTLTISEDELRNPAGPGKRSLYSHTSPPAVRPSATPAMATAVSPIDDRRYSATEAEHDRRLAPDSVVAAEEDEKD